MAVGGQEVQHLANNLFDHYNDSVNKKKEHARFVEGWRKDEDDIAFIEMKFKLKSPGASKDHAEKIQKHLDTMIAIIPDSETDLYFHPKVIALDDETIAFG